MGSDLSAIERVVGLLECGEQRGTAFLLTNEIIATCRHCIGPHLDEDAEIRFSLSGVTVQAAVCEPNVPEKHDVVLLRLIKPIVGAVPVPVVASHMLRGLAWETFGYPASRGRQGMVIGGTISRSVDDDLIPRDVDLQYEGADPPKSFGGFSGAPLVIDDTIRGVIQIRLDGGIGAVSFASLHEYLTAASVRFRGIGDHAYLPIGLSRELKGTIPNWRTFSRIEEALTALQKGYVLLSGHPGAGKTLISAGFQPTTNKMVIVGRYFAGGHPGSDLPPVYYRHLASFAKWLSVEASFRSSQAMGIRPDAPIGELAESISKNLNAIASTFEVRGSSGTLIIDGAEPAQHESQPCFLEYLPPAPPDGLAIILTTTDPNSLIQRYGHLIASAVVDTLPLPFADCESLAAKRLGEAASFEDVGRIAELSEGNPLALSYYVREALASRTRGEPNPWLASVGGLDQFYERVWNRFSNDPSARYLLAVGARVRGAISEGELLAIITPPQRAGCAESLKALRYLFRDTSEGVRFYHESFREFVLQHTASLHTEVHTAIADYCTSAKDSAYAAANLLHHHARSSAGGRSTSSLCTQSWLDVAAIRCAHPELLIADLVEILTQRLETGDVVESIRLLLLRSRLSYRYNVVFAVHAAQFARAAVVLRSPAQSLRFIVREGHLICTIDDTLSMLRSLVLGGHLAHAEQLYRELRARFWAAYEAGVVDYLSVVHQMVATYVVATSGIEGRGPLIRELWLLDKLLSEDMEAGGSDEDAQPNHLSYAYGTIGGESLWLKGFASCHDSHPVELAFMLETARGLAGQHGFIQHDMTRPAMPSGFQALDAVQVAEVLLRCASSASLDGDEARLVAVALMRTSDAFDLALRLFQVSMPLVREVSLREANGVDPDFPNLRLFQEAHELAGFTGERAASERVARATRHPWEELFLDAIAWLGLTNGQLYRERALGGPPVEEPFVERFEQELLPLIHFTLADRSEWEDAYHLPELVLPEILAAAAAIITEHEPASAPRFADIILDQEERQFGLYGEGYVRLLKDVANALGAIPEGTTAAADLRLAMHRFVRRNVFARRERVAGLLDCAQHLGRLGLKESAESAFRDAIDSSLGPDWYKEDQFGLIVEALEGVDERSFSEVHWRGAVETLAYASGESTFQRYVGQAKVSLIALLAGQGLHAEALSLYWHYLHPSYATQRQRIKSVEVDITSGLRGSRFGVQEIEQQRASLELIEGLIDVSPVMRWSILELFWPWGDDRDGDRFLRILSSLLRTDRSEMIGERFLRLLRVDVSPEHRRHFVENIQARDRDGIMQPWLEKAAALGIIDQLLEPASHSDPAAALSSNVTIPDQATERDPEEEPYLAGVFGRTQSLAKLRGAVTQAHKRMGRGDKESARSLLRDGLLAAQAGGWSIWHGSSEADAARSLLVSELGPVEQGVSDLAALILAEEHEGFWRIAQSLLNTVMPHLVPDRRHELHSVVMEHVEHLVRPERKAYSVERELEPLKAPIPPLTPTQCYEKWIVSLLDHPNCHMRDRTALLIEWMIANSEISVGPLIERTTSDIIGDGKEVALGILHRVLSKQPGIVEHIESHPRFESLLRDPNFLVRFLVEDVLGKPSQAGSEATEGGGLEALGHDEHDFCPEIASLIGPDQDTLTNARGWLFRTSPSLPIAELRELEDFRRMAYGGPLRHQGLAIEREAAYRALGGSKGEGNQDAILSASLWNPWWPDGDVRLDAPALIPGIVSMIQRSELEAAFAIGESTILHCYEIVPPDGDESALFREVVAVLVCKELLDKPPAPEKFWQSISVFDKEAPPYPGSILAMPTECAVARFEPGFRVGGDCTPALPTRRLIQLVGPDGFERICWNDGRRWDIWGPGPILSRGTALLCRTSTLRTLKNYDLLWIVLSDGAPDFAVHQRRGLLYRREDEHSADA